MKEPEPADEERRRGKAARAPCGYSGTRRRSGGANEDAALASCPMKTEAVFAVQEEIHRLRRRTGRRKELGRAHQGEAHGPALHCIRMLLVRRTYQELENNHIRFLRRELAGIAEYRPRPGSLPFPTARAGLRLLRMRRRSGPLPGGGVRRSFLDEATQLREEWMRQFAACLRGERLSQAYLLHLQPRRAGGTGTLRDCLSTEGLWTGKDPEDYEFIPARVTDQRAPLKKAAGIFTAIEGPAAEAQGGVAGG